MEFPSAVSEATGTLIARFFAAVSFQPGSSPTYSTIHELFLPEGLLVKRTTVDLDVSTVGQFIRPREASVSSGALSMFHEVELSASTESFAGVAHRLSRYEKSGILNGVPFAATGSISSQFVLTESGWRFTSMAWEDDTDGA